MLDRIFSSHRISAVLHFAAYSLVGESVEKPLVYYRNNVSRTIELIDAMVRYGINRFIFSSTAAIYGEPVKVPIQEDHPCQPTNPYGASKLTVERMLAIVRRLTVSNMFLYVILMPQARISWEHWVSGTSLKRI